MDLFDDPIGTLTALNPTAVLGTALGMGSSLINARAQSETNDRAEANSWGMFNAQREDSNTAHQRETRDLLAAGLNPILSATKGASVASGSSPSLVAPQIQGPDIMGALNLQEIMKNNAMNRELTKAQIQKTAADTAQVKQQTILDRNSMTGAASKFWEGLLNQDKSMPSFNSIKEKFKKRKKLDDDPRLNMP